MRDAIDSAVFPFWRGSGARLAIGLDRIASRLAFRIAVALVLASLHLVAFWRAGHDRLDLPFNSAPDHAPYFSNPDAPVLTTPPRQPHFWARLVVSRFDAQHYIATSVRGLTACPTEGDKATDSLYLQCGLGWLPAYGEVGSVVARVTTLADDYALVLVSVLSLILINLMWTSNAFVSRLGKLEAYMTLIAFNAFPAMCYTVTPHAEALTIACVLGAFVLIHHDRWWLASIFVGAATALKPHAVAYTLAFGCAALAATWQKRRAGERRWWRPLASCALAGWGQLATLFALKVSVGDAWAFFRARHAFGDSNTAHRLVDGATYISTLGGQNMDGVFWWSLIGIALLVWRDTIAKMRLDEKAFLLGAGLLTSLFGVIASPISWGTSRYMMLCLLAFLCAGKLARRYPVLFAAFLALCLVAYWNIDLCNYITQGDPRVCSCQGRLEMYLPF
jgi:hypothetical protein